MAPTHASRSAKVAQRSTRLSSPASTCLVRVRLRLRLRLRLRVRPRLRLREHERLVARLHLLDKGQ
jgi:hypothetical protein